ncbi:Poly(U)-binding-splicing factor PUF60 [Trichinella nativa]|uniref:Poly(U)-binding-splicing factor PUF60 n=1 Tax=Trichinella nativa TaxID=6335 RepID=A0A0V1L6P3_9BILA|nr:Poly(U)-binding-splicing factor PUF60 [Trichinella nativa]
METGPPEDSPKCLSSSGNTDAEEAPCPVNTDNEEERAHEFGDDDMPPYCEQEGSVVVGPGARKEALLLGLGLPKLSSKQYEELARAKKYAMDQSVKTVLMKQTVQHQQQQQKLAMYAQALSLMARVYIGSISFELREETVKGAFQVFGPIKSINMSWDPITGHHKGFAFLEYEVPEAATLAQDQMNGVLIGGRNIKVGRPSNMPQAQPIIESIIEEAKLHHRIYVSSIHPDLTESDVKSVFEAFGNIINVDLPKGQLHGKHKGYAYIDFDSAKAALDAVSSMNMFDLGGQLLRVGRAITPPMAQQFIVPASTAALPTAAAVAAAAVTAKIQAMEVVTPAVLGVASSAGIVGSGFSNAPVLSTLPPPGFTIPQLTPPSAVVAPKLHAVSVKSNETAESVNAMKISGSLSTASEISQKLMASSTSTSPDTLTTMPKAPLPVESMPTNVSVESVASGSGLNLPSSSSSAQRLLQNSMLNDRQKAIDLEAAQTLASQEDLKIKGNEARNILMHKLMRRFEVLYCTVVVVVGFAMLFLFDRFVVVVVVVQSCVLVLRNVISPEEVDEYLQEEITEECGKFGEVEQVVIYQEKPNEDAPAIVKIFVKYSNPEEAEKAQSTFHNRFFSGRQITAELYDQTMFDLQDLSG